MQNPQYFLMPFEGYPDKLIKIVGEKVHISWRSSQGNHKDDVDLEKFQKHNTAILIPINEAEYNFRFAEFFPQYIEEKG